MRNHKKAILSFALLALVCAYAVPSAHAFIQVIDIDDRTESITLSDQGVVKNACRSGVAFEPENCVYTVPFTMIDATDFVLFFVEPQTRIFSDSIALHFRESSNLTFVDITFMSDAVGLVGDLPGEPLGPGDVLEETGFFQTVFNVTDQSGNQLIIRFASDVATSVSGPATFALFGLALAGLGFTRRKRAAN